MRYPAYRGLLCLAALLGAPALAGPVNLDAFLHGVDDECRYSDDLERFRRALVRPKFARTLVPADIRAAVGEIRVQDDTDYQMFSVPIAGAWRGVPVQLIEFGLGKGNGIHVLLVEFGGAPAAARAAFGASVEQSRQRMASDPENFSGATIELSIDAGRARLICDLST